MKKCIYILIYLLLSSVFGTYAQKEKINTINDLSTILRDTIKRKKYSSKDIKSLKRTYWFLSDRYDQSGTIKGYKDAVESYYSQFEEDKEVSLMSISSLTWEYIGPKGWNNGTLRQSRGSIGRGWIETIHVIDENIIYAGARNSGLWYTSDGGYNWKSSQPENRSDSCRDSWSFYSR
jgi:hypothetical protein